MEVAATRLYERLGSRYLAVCHLLYAAAGGAVVALGALLFSRLVEVSTGELLLLIAVAEAVTLIAFADSARWFVRGQARPITDWILRGKQADGAAELWSLAISLPQSALRTAVARVVPFVAIPTAGAMALILDLSVLELSICALGLVIAASYPAVIFEQAMALELRPILRDIATRVPGGIDRPSGGSGLGSKLMVTIPVLNVAAGGFVALIAAGLADGSVADLGLGVVSAIAIALTTTLALTAMVVRSLMIPVTELVAATRRVGQGRPGPPAPVLSADELGRLAHSFNRMVDDLAERDALRARSHELRRRAERLAAERQAEARRIVLEERARIGRELHAVVDHSLGLIAMQTDRTRRLAGDDPSSSIAALAAIESAGRDALGELRSLLGVLRSEGDPALTPQPRAADIPELVGRIRDVGVSVELRILGELETLERGVGLSADRVVQASIAVALKRDGGAEIAVTVERTVSELMIRTEMAAAPGDLGPTGSDEDLIGIGERVELLGGRLDAGPRDGGGFAISVSLPLLAGDGGGTTAGAAIKRGQD